VLFGTQTGTAERFSKQIKAELTQRYGEDTAYDVVDVEEYEHEEKLVKEKLVFLMLATYGDGEPTDNAANFFTWVTKAAAEADKGGGKLLEVGHSLTRSAFAQLASTWLLGEPSRGKRRALAAYKAGERLL